MAIDMILPLICTVKKYVLTFNNFAVAFKRINLNLNINFYGIYGILEKYYTTTTL